MLLSMAAFQMAPFGDRSTLIMDMSGQYVEFFCGLKQILRDGNLSSLFFSWGKTMGGNAVGVFAYYISSPLSVMFFTRNKSGLRYGVGDVSSVFKSFSFCVTFSTHVRVSGLPTFGGWR